MARVLGLVNLHSSPELSVISKSKSLAALTFLGRYAFVDIPLSNFTNSNINTVGILVNKSPRSMIKHMDNAMCFTNNTKLGKTIICYNEQYANNALYNTDINNIIENEWLIDEGKFKYVVIAPSHIVCKMNFNEIIDAHIKSEAPITIVYKNVKTGKTDFIDQDVVDIDENGYLSQIKKNLGVNDDINISLETYILNIDKLKELLKFAQSTSKFFTLKDVIDFVCSTTKVATYEFTGFVRIIKSIQSYLQVSLEMLDSNILNQLISEDWPIYTKTHDTPPAKYLENAVVRNSFVSNGAIIDGKIENSIICREVKVNKGATIKNSIILSDTVIAEDAHLEYVIADKGAKIIHVKELKGTKANPLYVGSGDVI